MKLDDVTPEMIVQAARIIQERKGTFTAKDLWYELDLSDRYNKYCGKRGDARRISQLIRKKEICDKFERVRTDSSGHAWYRVKE